jgi:hypothetical protein
MTSKPKRPVAPPEAPPAGDWMRRTEQQWPPAMLFENALHDLANQATEPKRAKPKGVERAVLKAMKKGKKR